MGNFSNWQSKWMKKDLVTRGTEKYPEAIRTFQRGPLHCNFYYNYHIYWRLLLNFPIKNDLVSGDLDFSSSCVTGDLWQTTSSLGVFPLIWLYYLKSPSQHCFSSFLWVFLFLVHMLRKGGAWTRVVEMEVVSSSQILDSFSRKHLKNVLMGWTQKSRKILRYWVNSGTTDAIGKSERTVESRK